jgi:hypothetical protein
MLPTKERRAHIAQWADVQGPAHIAELEHSERSEVSPSRNDSEIEPNGCVILRPAPAVSESARLIPTAVPLGRHLRLVTGSRSDTEALTRLSHVQVSLRHHTYLYQCRTRVGPQTLANVHALYGRSAVFVSGGHIQAHQR